MNTEQIVNLCQERLQALEKMIPTKLYNNRINEIDHIVNSTNIWSEPQKAAKLMKERQRISEQLSKLSAFKDQVSFYYECITDLPEELTANAHVIDNLYKEISEMEFREMMKDPVDDSPAILSINAGAGGLEAANWVNILLRMYSRYADSYKFTVEYLDIKPSEEHSSICIASVSIRIDGPYAFGFLKGGRGTSSY